MIRRVLCVLSILGAYAPAQTTQPTSAPAAVSADGFRVTVDGTSRPVDVVRIAPADPKRRWLAMDDADHPTAYFDQAASVLLPIEKPTTVLVHCRATVTAAKVLPASAAVPATVAGHDVTFTVKPGQYLTLEINGDITHALHLFADAPFTPAPADADVIAFARGVHYVKDTIQVTSGQTVELAEGAIVYGVGDKGPIFHVTGDHVTFRGRGILDGSMTPRHTRCPLSVTDASDVSVSGITIRDASVWNFEVRRSDRVAINDVKIFGYRANSDGIDVCNSRDVTIDHCFVRTLDDLIVVKTDKGQGPTQHVSVRDCVLWNQVAHALSIGAEIREPIEDVLFANCDILHDTGREWTLRVYNTDAGPVRRVRFENIRVANSAKFISLWIGQAGWSRDAERGRIDDVTFKNVTCAAGAAKVELQGAAAQHAVRGTTFDHVTIGGKPLTEKAVVKNDFVDGVRVVPTSAGRGG